MKTLILSLLIASPAIAGKPDCKIIFDKSAIIVSDFLSSIRAGNLPSHELLRSDGRPYKPNVVRTHDGSIALLILTDNNRSAQLIELGALGSKPRITNLNKSFRIDDSFTLTKERNLVHYDGARIQVIDLKTKDVVRHFSTGFNSNQNNASRADISNADRNYMFWTPTSNQINVLDLRTLEVRTLRNYVPYRIVASADGHFAIYSRSGTTAQSVVALRTSDFQKVAEYPAHDFTVNELFENGQILAGAELLQSGNYKLQIFKNGKQTPIAQKIVRLVSVFESIGKGKYLYTHDDVTGELNIFSLATKKFIPIARKGKGLHESQDNNSLVLASDRGFWVFDARTGKQYSISNTSNFTSESVNANLGITAQNKLLLVTHESDPEGNHDGTTQLVEVDLNSKEVQVTEQIENMQPGYYHGNSAIQIFGDYNHSIPNFFQTLAEAKAKPETQKFLQSMAEKFESGEYLNDPQETLRNLLILADISPISVIDIFKKYPQMTESFANIDLLKPEGRAEEARISLQAQKFIETLKPDSLSVNEFIQFVRPLREILDSEVLSESIQKYASMTLRKTELSTKPEIKQIPSYNRFKLIKEYIKGQIGLPWKSSSDLVVTYDRNLKTQIVIFGSHQIDNSQLNEFGFYSILKSEFKVEGNRSANISWRHGDKRLQAQVKIRPLKSKDLRPPNEESPDYESMTADKKLGGAILISPNIDDAENFAVELANNYKNFYRAQGYKFEVENMSGSQALGLLIQKVEMGEIDYMVREGHSEAQTDSVVSLWNEVTVTIGRKTKKGGIEESIYILGPKNRSSNPDSSTSMSFSALGRSLRSRTVSSDFIFLQTACMSADNLGNYVGMVAARGFIPLATDDMADTFTNEKNSPIRLILTGILNQKPWSEMRKEVDLNDGRSRYDRPETYVFPDQEEYVLGRIGGRTKVADVAIERSYKVLEEQSGK